MTSHYIRTSPPLLREFDVFHTYMASVVYYSMMDFLPWYQGLRSALVGHCKHWLYISIDDNMRFDSRSIYLIMPWVKHSDPHIKSNKARLIGRFLVLGLAC